MLAALAAAGCAEERPPINQVQANALNKHFFVGDDLASRGDDPEFYWRNYVVDAQAGQSLIGVGSWSGVDRVRWEVTEHALIARKAYEIAKGAGARAGAGKVTNGAIVASYRIEAHFDIRRDYNRSTGEETNVIVENQVDRPWNLREYMRVDWSTNQVENPMWQEMFLGNVMGDVRVTPLTYTETDPAADNAPHFDAEDGYFDVTNHYFIEPVETESPFSDVRGKVPTCMVIGLYTGSATYDCNAQEAVVRSSFLRVREDADFEPLENTRAPMDVLGNPGGMGESNSVGLVTPGQQGWDPGYGYVDRLYHRFAHVHNVWKKSHQRAACGSEEDADANGTADACENAVTGYKGSSGSQCDTFTGKCTLPYRDREVKTVGYWVNPEMPDLLQEPDDEDPAAASARRALSPSRRVPSSGEPDRAAQGPRGPSEDLMYSWNQLMAGAVARAREVECRRTGDGDRAICHDRYFEPEKVMVSYGAWLTDAVRDPTPVLTLCHNPVRKDDLHGTCGPEGYRARVGDLRHNFLIYWPYESRAPWGGIADWNADPLTGEIVGAAAWIMGRSVTQAAAMQRDVLQVTLGDTALAEITDGAVTDRYAGLLRDGPPSTGLSAGEIERRVTEVDADGAVDQVRPADLPGATVAERYSAFVDMMSRSSADPTAQSTAQLEHDALVQPLLGSIHEAQLADPHWLIGALGADPATPLDGAALDAVSPLRAMDPGRVHALRDLLSARMRLHGVCFLDAEAPIVGSVDMQGLAGYFGAKYGDLDRQARGEAMYRDLVIEAYKGVAIHEVGHSLGMLHQFASSWDAPNYAPQYWQLRTAEGSAEGSCEGQPRPEGADSCMGPRYLDPETADERGVGGEPRPGITYFGSSSVMEYQIERFGETVGLGTYDRHVMNALYGRVLETMDDPEHGGLRIQEQRRFAPRMESQLIEADRVTRLIPGLGTAPWPAHYTEVARRMRLFDPERDCRAATEEEKEIGAWRVVHGKVCSPPPRDHAAWRDFLSDEVPAGGPAPFWHTRPGAADGGERVRWFYRWGVTHNSYLHTNDSDAGADPYEVTLNTIRKFDVSYPFSHFRRKNREYNYRALPASVADRYFERLRSYHRLVATATAFYRSFGDEVYDLIAGEDDWHRPYLVAERGMFSLLARAALMPEPGEYEESLLPGQSRPTFDLGRSATPRFELGIDGARYIAEEYDSDPAAGGSWDYQRWMRHAGFSTEKTFALRALVDGRTNLFSISRKNFLDGRAAHVSFRADFGPAVDRLLGGILSEDWESVAPWVSPADGDAPRVRLLDLAAGAPTRDADARIVFPNIGYKQQLAAVMFTSIFSRLGGDMSLVNKLRIWIDGHSGAVALAPEEQARFRDPETGYTYVARRYGVEVIDGKVVEKGIASRMIGHANDLLAAAYEVETDAAGAPITDEYGSVVLTRGPDGQPVLRGQGGDAARDLRAYVGLLDATRQIAYKLGQGPLTGGEDD